ncbi:MAG: 23S rRNA (adenine(2030)-N(6))-methyltransferase RlmJ [Labrys sp. (in: a-proteobacteria)]
MNYRHGFHAGNFADVFKHALLARVLVHLKKKDAAFRVLDTHAGAGAHDIGADAAARTLEWEGGIGRLAQARLPQPVADLLAPYLGLVQATFDSRPTIYPGSPLLAMKLSRPQDRLVFCEKHPDEARRLQALTRRDQRVTVLPSDGWSALSTQLPPTERRGVVLIDPPFEDPREFQTIVDGLKTAHRRWATGIFVIWYPIKARRPIEAFIRKIVGLDIPKILRTEIGLYPVERIDRLNGCGLLIVNPPWQLDSEWSLIGPCLADLMAVEGSGWCRTDWISPEES